jgi:hypothetical protein
MIYSDDIDEDINSLLDVLLLIKKDPNFKPPGKTTVEKYKETIVKKIEDLEKLRYRNIIRRNNITPDEFDRELKMGIDDEEKEHKGDKLKSTDIALDHLSKDPNYYSKLKKIEGDNNLSFESYFKLACNLEDNVLGLIEPIKIDGVDAELIALVDTGNEAFNVLHGVDIEDMGDKVSFTTANKKRITKDKIDEIVIHVGAGHDEHRPVVEFTIEIGSKVYPDVKFSIGDRTKNQHPVLIGADFLKQINALVDVSK